MKIFSNKMYKDKYGVYNGEVIHIGKGSRARCSDFVNRSIEYK